MKRSLHWVASRTAMGLLGLGAAAALAAACGSSGDVTSFVTPPALGVVHFGAASDPGVAADPLTIDTAFVRDGRLHVLASYGGGCATHSFAALTDGAWAESKPVKLGVLIAHDAHGDACDALQEVELRFDLRPVRQAFTRAYRQSSGEVALRLAPAAEPGRERLLVNYIF